MTKKKEMMIGNGAVARGLYEAGCHFVSSYPGTPSTEITEFAAEYDAIYAEWAPNEKVAVEAAIGASIAGARAFSGMKHVGVNVAADPIFTVSYTGVNGGLVIGVADDQGMHSSQNEQDSRNYAIAAKIPMLEPSDSAECLAYTKRAFELSEQFDTPVFLRLSTRIAHSQSMVETEARADIPLKDYTKDPSKYVMVPAAAKVRRHAVAEREAALTAFAETTDLNRIEWHDRSVGIIASGIAYQYAREALGEKASYLKLGLIHPMPKTLIADFARQVETLYVVEELDAVIETFCLKNGVQVQGKAVFSEIGEYTPAMIRAAVLGESAAADSPAAIPGRPPVLCPGCPHRGVFRVLGKMKLTVTGDIGCYTLGAAKPLGAIDTTVCMGASISALHGFNTVRPDRRDKSVAVIGDSTFIHSGITGLIDIVYNQSGSTVLILDNSITGMTGHQQNPATGLTIKNKPAPALDLEAVCRAVGVRRVRTVDAHDMEGLEACLREELKAEEPSVIIAKRPCVLLKHVKRLPALSIDADACTRCGACLRLGCPAIRKGEAHMEIDPSLCVGCGLCARVCKFDAIKGGEENA